MTMTRDIRIVSENPRDCIPLIMDSTSRREITLEDILNLEAT